MLITPTQVQVTLDRQQDLIAAVVRDRLTTAATPPAPATPGPVGRIHHSLRHAVTALIALVAIG